MVSKVSNQSCVQRTCRGNGLETVQEKVVDGIRAAAGWLPMQEGGKAFWMVSLQYKFSWVLQMLNKRIPNFTKPSGADGKNRQ